MANFAFGKDSLKVILSSRERRALSRPGLTIDKARLLFVSLEKLPGKLDLGVKVSKVMLFSGISGECRSNAKKLLVLGIPSRSELSLRIRVSHPNIDEIWVRGAKGEEMHQELVSFMGSSQAV